MFGPWGHWQSSQKVRRRDHGRHKGWTQSILPVRYNRITSSQEYHPLKLNIRIQVTENKCKVDHSRSAFMILLEKQIDRTLFPPNEYQYIRFKNSSTYIVNLFNRFINIISLYKFIYIYYILFVMSISLCMEKSDIVVNVSRSMWFLEAVLLRFSCSGEKTDSHNIVILYSDTLSQVPVLHTNDDMSNETGLLFRLIL